MNRVTFLYLLIFSLAILTIFFAYFDRRINRLENNVRINAAKIAYGKNCIYDSVYVNGDTISFYKSPTLLGRQISKTTEK